MNQQLRDLVAQADIIWSTSKIAASPPMLGGVTASPLKGVHIVRFAGVSRIKSTLYCPVAVLILRGCMDARLGDNKSSYGPGDSTIMGHDSTIMGDESPISYQIAQSPFQALLLPIELAFFRKFMNLNSNDNLQPPNTNTKPINRYLADTKLLSAYVRLLESLRNPGEAKLLTPSIIEEIHVRLLMISDRTMLREPVWQSSRARQIAKAITFIKDNIDCSIPVKELASEVGMSASSFHDHFKKIVKLSPSQYMKELRLRHAKKILGNGRQSVLDVAYEVGYKSASHFSRDYSRQFGVSPRTEKG